MNTKRVAKLYYRKMRLPFLICFGLAVLFQVFQTLLWKIFDVIVPSTFFLSAAFYFVFILWNGKAFDRLFLQFSVSRREQLCGFFAFLPAALLGALCNAGIASVSAFAQLDIQNAEAISDAFALFFQENMMLKILFSGNIGKVILLTVLFQAVNSIRWMVVARAIVTFRRLLPVWARVVLGLLTAQAVFWFGIGDIFAADDGDLPLGEIPYTFCFGTVSPVGILLSRLATMGIFAGILVLCMYRSRKRKIVGKCKANQTRRIKLAVAGIVLSVALGAFSVCFCSPALINILEYTGSTESAVPSASEYGTDAVHFAPNEKAYQLLKIQKKTAVGAYRHNLARHMAAVYFPPDAEVLFDTDYTVGKQYYELYFSSSDVLSIEVDSLYNFQFPGHGVDLYLQYFQYLYQNGEKDGAFAFLEVNENNINHMYITADDFPIWVYQNGTEEEALRIEGILIQYALAGNTPDLTVLQTLLGTAPSQAVYEKTQTDILEVYAPSARAALEKEAAGDVYLPPYYAAGGGAAPTETQQFIKREKEFAQDRLNDLNTLCEQAQKPYASA